MNLAHGLKLVLVACAGLTVAGCETLRRHAVHPAPEPPVLAVRPPEVVEVEPPGGARPPPQTARGCVPRTLGPPPRYPDSDAALRAAAGAADRYQLMAAGRLMRQKRLEELERAVAACR
jgi:hypothetical protein